MSAGVHGSAVVVRGTRVQIASAAGYPTVLWKDKVEVPCTCAALVGIRLDRHEWTVVATNCDQEGHYEMMRTFVEGYARLIEDGGGPLDLIEAAAQLLSRAFGYDNLEE